MFTIIIWVLIGDTKLMCFIELIKLDPENRKIMGKNAIKYAMKNFSIETLANKNFTIYKKLLK